jgi:L-alanine-DL-glutamate epimerase-like enolase superfamily enzyme
MAEPAQIVVTIDTFALARIFTISRGSKSVATVVTARLAVDGITAHGECVPYPRYGETFETVARTVREALQQIDLAKCAEHRTDALSAAQRLLPAGAARNCVEAVCVDLHCQTQRVTAAEVYGVAPPQAVQTCATVSLGPPATMAEEALSYAPFRTLKLKLDGEPALTRERLDAVRLARPDAELIVDANEAWRPDDLATLCAAADDVGVTLIEQPVPAGDDAALDGVTCRAVICADESLHTRDDLTAIAQRYGAINIKLDKTGGLGEALKLAAAARAHGLKIMVGSMVSTSLSMAPALLVAQGADWVDLDSPALLAEDRPGALALVGDVLHPPDPDATGARLWG